MYIAFNAFAAVGFYWLARVVRHIFLVLACPRSSRPAPRQPKKAKKSAKAGAPPSAVQEPTADDKTQADAKLTTDGKPQADADDKPPAHTKPMTEGQPQSDAESAADNKPQIVLGPVKA